MQRILRLLLPLALLGLMAGLVACGGDDEASSDTSVQELLDKTFTGDKQVDSGRFDLRLKLDISGGGAGVSGPVDLHLSGPFESQGASKLPKFDVDLEATGAGQNIQAGLTSTGEKGFVNFNGQEYAVSDEVFQQFKQGFEQAAAQGGEQGEGQSLTDLGINPRNWLTDPENAGEAKVGDTDVIKITGGVDVGKLLEDINQALTKAGSLGLEQADLPTQLTDEQKQQVEEAIQDVSVEISTGKDDTILRRMLVNLNASEPGGEGKAAVTFDLQLTELNEGQDFPEPENTKPFEELLGQFGGSAGLGGLLGGGGAPGSGSGSGGGSGGATQESLQEYSQCIEDAGQDLEAAQECAELLNP